VETNPSDSFHVKNLKRFFNARDTDGFVNYWRRSGLDPNFEDSSGRGFMHWLVMARAANRGVSLPRVDAFFASQYGNVTRWDRKDYDGRTPLGYAVANGLLEEAEALLDRGASPEMQVSSDICSNPLGERKPIPQFQIVKSEAF
jgi:ankyrin repeat protein